MPYKDKEKAKAYAKAWREVNKEKLTAQKKAYQSAHEEKLKAYQAAWRATHKEELKARDAAYYAANRDRINASNAAWRATHKEELKAQQTAYQAAHRDELLAKKAAWRKANPDKKKAADAAYYAANRDNLKAKATTYYAANRDRINASNASRKKANPDKVNALNARHRARKLNQTPDDASQILIEWLFTAAKLMSEATGQPFHIDHVIPLAAGGLHHEDNLQILPASENCSKNAKVGVDPTGPTVSAMNSLLVENGVSPYRRLQIQIQ